MLLAHKIRLDPTNTQRTFFAQYVGVSRFAYNWALTEWQQQYAAGEHPHEVPLRQLLNGMKGEQFPWMLDVPKTVPQQAIKNLGNAFHRFFTKLGEYPKRKKKFRHDSARLDNGPVKKGTDAVQIKCKKIKVPKLGWVRMTESVRFSGQIKSCTLSRTADDWFVSLMIDTAPPVPTKKAKGSTVGVDLGVKAMATLSTGETIEGPKAHKAKLARLKRLDRVMARRKKGSANRKKAAIKRAKCHQQVANIRSDFIHKLTTDLSQRFETIVIEDLHVAGMVKNHHLARAISDMGFRVSPPADVQGRARRRHAHGCAAFLPE
jgi:putative transposase